MASVETLRSDFGTFEADWIGLRPFLLQYLPHDRRLGKADRLFAGAKRSLERATRADEKRQILLAFWWYAFALTRIREYRQLVEELGERGLQAQEEANKQRKATA